MKRRFKWLLKKYGSKKDVADGICEGTCSAVFGTNDEGEAYVKEDADFSANEEGIKEAAEECPGEVIKYEEG